MDNNAHFRGAKPWENKVCYARLGMEGLKISNTILITFWLTVGSFLVVLGEMIFPPFRQLFRGSRLFLIPFAIFFIFALLLLVFTMRGKVEGKLRTFLLLAGGSGAGVFISILLHNFLYGMFVHFFGEGIWKGVGGDEPVFFILGLIICPLGFLVGVVGTIVKLMGHST